MFSTSINISLLNYHYQQEEKITKQNRDNEKNNNNVRNCDRDKN